MYRHGYPGGYAGYGMGPNMPNQQHQQQQPMMPNYNMGQVIIMTINVIWFEN